MHAGDPGRKLGEGRASGILKTIGNPVNLQILMLLTGGGMNTREIARILNRDESDISRRLRKLRELGLVTSQWSRAGGRNVKVYRLSSEKLNIQIDKHGLRIIDGTSTVLDLKELTGSAWKPPQPPPYFVGRVRELEFLRRAYRKSPVIVVTGLPGIGKTSLVAYWLQRDRVSPVLWHWGTPSDYSDNMLKRIALFLSSHGKTRLRNYIYKWSREPETLIPTAVEELSELKATIVIDDMHKIIDPKAIELIGLLARGAGDYKLVLISREVPKLPLDVHSVESIVLGGISRGDTEKLVRILMEEPPSPHAVGKLHSIFDGHPMLIKWTIDLARSQGLGFLNQIARSSKGYLPARRFVEELYKSLDPHEQRVLVALACIGGRVSTQEDWGLFRKGREKRALNRLVGKNIVVETPFHYIVKELVQNLVSRELTAEECRPPAETLIKKLTKTDDAQKYLDAFSVAATWGYEDLLLTLIRHRLANVGSRIFEYLHPYKILVERALEKTSDPYVRAALLSEKAVIAYNLEKDKRRAVEYLRTAIPLLEEAGENLMLAFVYSRLIYFDEENALKMARKALKHASLIRNPRGKHLALNHIHANLAYHYTRVKNVEKMLYHVEEEVRHSQFIGDVEEYWYSVFQREIARYLARGKVDLKLVSKARRVLSERGRVEYTLTVATYETLLLLIMKNVERAVKVASRALQELSETPHSTAVMHHVCNLVSLIRIGLEMEPKLEKKYEAIAEQVQGLMEKCRVARPPSCFYWALVKERGSGWERGIAGAKTREYCSDYDLDLFRSLHSQ